MRILLIILFVITTNLNAQQHFQIGKDLLIANYDSKPDVDDLMSVAAFATILNDDRFEMINYIAVAGAYGQQEGDFIEADHLFNIAFGDSWVNAHEDRIQAIETLFDKASVILNDGGNLWIAEAGQSDVSADLLKMIKEKHPEIKSRERITIVQHSWWNESVTTPEKLLYARDYTNYTKIPDGNGLNNGTPGFKTSDGSRWVQVLSDEKVGEIWKEAKRLALKYNIVAGYDNVAVREGGFDFSDTSEVCWILGFNYLKDTDEFFDEFLNK